MSETDSVTRKWVRVTQIENIPLREGRSVQIAGHDIAIFNLGDGFLAVENKCPHRGGPLADGIVTGGNVVCPLHAWKVDLATGEVVNRTDNPPCAKTFATRIENGIVSLELPIDDSGKTQLPTSCFSSVSPAPCLNGNVTSEV